MRDDFTVLFGWFPEQFEKHPIDGVFSPGSVEHDILTRFRDGWGAGDTADLLRELSAAYGEKAGQAIEDYFAACLRQNWAQIGKRESHAGAEIEDFIRVLWEPLREDGFEFTIERTPGTAELRVTRCPLADLAERTGLHDWVYHLACATDFYTTPAFSPGIEFTRTKTLVQGHNCCNHRYCCRDQGAAKK